MVENVFFKVAFKKKKLILIPFNELRFGLNLQPYWPCAVRKKKIYIVLGG